MFFLSQLISGVEAGMETGAGAELVPMGAGAVGAAGVRQVEDCAAGLIMSQSSKP